MPQQLPSTILMAIMLGKLLLRFCMEDIIHIYIYIYLGIMFSFREGKSKKFSRSNRNTHMFSSSHHGSDFLGIGKGQARESTMSATNEDISA